MVVSRHDEDGIGPASFGALPAIALAATSHCPPNLPLASPPLPAPTRIAPRHPPFRVQMSDVGLVATGGTHSRVRREGVPVLSPPRDHALQVRRPRPSSTVLPPRPLVSGRQRDSQNDVKSGVSRRDRCRFEVKRGWRETIFLYLLFICFVCIIWTPLVAKGSEKRPYTPYPGH